MSAFSPTVNAPSELISPSTLPSMSSSFWNLMVPLISTSLERTSLPECSAINFLYSFGCDFGWSPWDRFESSPPELSDPSPIDEIVLCGMNFFNTYHHCNGYSHCQRVRGQNRTFLEFIRKSEQLRRSILAGEKQIGRSLTRGTIQKSANRSLRNRHTEEFRGLRTDSVPIVGKNPFDSAVFEEL